MRFVTLVLFLLATFSPAQQKEGNRMSPAQVVDNVKHKNWGMVEQPGNVGPDAGPALLPLLDDPDSQVRQLTVTCLNEAGGPAARQGLLKELKDRTETVRAAAARFLRAHYAPPDLPAIVDTMNTSPDEYVREQMALLLGESGDPSKIPALAAHIPAEKDEHARRAASLAMARLGDPSAKSQLVARLQRDDPKERVAALRDLPYVNDISLLKHVIPLLDDTRPGLNVGPSHGPYWIHVCDVAVNIANQMLGGRFRFVERVKRYSPEEINEVKRVLSTIQ
jgi:HEAT repeat protein